MMRPMIGRYKGFRCARMVAGVKRSVLARVGAVKPSLAPVRNEMLNTSGSRRIILENLSR